MKAAIQRAAHIFGFQIRRTTRPRVERKIRGVEDHIRCHHSHDEMMLMADFLLNSPLKGPMVECGCYKGGSTARLSLLAKETKRRLFVFDSFQGLPEPGEIDRTHHWARSGESLHYRKGEYSGTIDEVRMNIAKFGAIECCEFMPGFFGDTLRDFPETNLSFVFLDVDYISSARDCLRWLWPKLVRRTPLYSRSGNARIHSRDNRS